MEIHAKQGAGSVPRIAATQTPKPMARTAADEVNFSRSAELTAALSDTPEVRSPEVSRLARVVGQAAYPPAETLLRIAELLAIKMK